MLKHCLILFFFLSGANAFADVVGEETRLQLVRHPEQAIPHLDWDQSRETQEPRLQTKAIFDENDGPYFVILNGSYPREDGEIFYNGKSVPIDSKGDFSLEIPVNSTLKAIKMTWIHSSGNAEYDESLELLFPEWDHFYAEQIRLAAEKLRLAAEKKQREKEARIRAWEAKKAEEAKIAEAKEAAKKAVNWTLGIGETPLAYQQTGFSNLSETLLTLKLSGEIRLGDWEVISNASFSPITVTPDPSGTQMAQFGMDFVLGPKYILSSEPLFGAWSFSVLGGFFYQTTSSSPTATLGFTSLQGPEIYSTLRYASSKGRRVWVYAKYSIIYDGQDFLNTGNYQLGYGGGLTLFTFKDQQALDLLFDSTSIALQLGSNANLQMNFYTLGIGFRF